MGKTPFAGPHKMISCSGCIILLPQGLGNEFLTWKEAETCQQCPPVMPTFVAQCLLSKLKGKNHYFEKLRISSPLICFHA